MIDSVLPFFFIYLERTGEFSLFFLFALPENIIFKVEQNLRREKKTGK